MSESLERTKASLIFAAIVGVASMTGCGSDRGTVPVSGTVTLDGEPLAGASVSFSPTGSSGQAAAGVTDSSGKFELTTYESGDGAVPGSYQVAVTKTADSGEAAGGTGSSGNEVSPDDLDSLYAEAEKSGANVMADAGDKKKGDEIEFLVPEMYTSPETSGLEAEVTESAEQNTFTFELTSGSG